MKTYKPYRTRTFAASASALVAALTLSVLSAQQPVEPTPADRLTQPTSPAQSDALSPAPAGRSSTSDTPASATTAATSVTATDDTKEQHAAAQAGTLQVATKENSEYTLRKLAGQGVRNDLGEKLGTLKDFVVDPATGKIVYAIVTSGGVAGAGNTLRAVPAEAFQRSTAHEGFVVAVEAAKFSQAPALDERAFNDGRVAISAEQSAQLNQLFETKGATHSADASVAASGAPTRLQRASELRGKAIRAGASATDKIGDVEEIVIDWDQNLAHALVDPNDDFTGSNAKTLVPLSRVSLAPTGDWLTASLTRADFTSAPSGAENVATTLVKQAPDESLATAPSARLRDAEEFLTPTGATSADQMPKADAALIEQARAVRRALDSNTAFARANVQVSPENGRVILRGSVSDQELKTDVERAARDASPGAQIDNQLSIVGENQP